MRSVRRGARHGTVPSPVPDKDFQTAEVVERLRRPAGRGRVGTGFGRGVDTSSTAESYPHDPGERIGFSLPSEWACCNCKQFKGDGRRAAQPPTTATHYNR
jgi:hypothetical protein